VPEAAPIAATLPESRRPPRLMLAKEHELDAAATSSAASSLTSALSCLSIGPFATTGELETIAKRLQDAGFTAAPRTEKGEVFAGYWVSLQGLATRADAEQTLKRLHAAGVTDAYIMPDDNPPNVLSLGLFSEPSRAEARRDAIAKLGFEVQVQNRMRNGEVHWLDVSLQEPGQLIDPTLLQPESGGIVRLETTACPAVSAAQISSQISSQGSSQSSSPESASSQQSSQTASQSSAQSASRAARKAAAAKTAAR
jgi:cell division protein FtsN